MDNVTHALAGMLVAEVVVQHRARRESESRPVTAGWGRWAYVVSVVANNLPDLDIVYVGITGGKLGYLAHHRGHTHTLLFAIVQALLVLGALRLLRRRTEARSNEDRSKEDRSRENWSREDWSREDWRWIGVIAAVGPLLHLAMDGANNYGVHPFWPVDRSWHYGDRMYIVEPLLWAGIAPVLAFAVASRVAKIGLLLVALVGLVLTWVTGFVPLPSAILVTATMIIVGGLAWKLEPGRRVAVAVGVSLVVYATFVGVGARARQLVEEVGRRGEPDERLVDAALTPLPANPRCWSLHSLSVTDTSVVLRRGVVLPLGEGDPEQLCPARFGEPTAPLEPVDGPTHGAVRFLRVMRYSRVALAQAAASCHGAAFLRWSRLPFFVRHDDQAILGDLRYDFDESLGWAEIAMPAEGTPCPRFVPDWTPPRYELWSSPD